MPFTNALAYSGTEMITTVKWFIAQTPGDRSVSRVAELLEHSIYR